MKNKTQNTDTDLIEEVNKILKVGKDHLKESSKLIKSFSYNKNSKYDVLKEREAIYAVKKRAYLIDLMKDVDPQQLSPELNERITKELNELESIEGRFLYSFNSFIISKIKFLNAPNDMFEDLYAEAINAIRECILKFDIDAPNVLTTYATLEVNAKIQSFYQDFCQHRTRTEFDDVRRIERFKGSFFSEHGREATIDEIVDNVKFPANGSTSREGLKKYVLRILQSKTNVSMDKEVGDDQCVGDFISDDSQVKKNKLYLREYEILSDLYKMIESYDFTQEELKEFHDMMFNAEGDPTLDKFEAFLKEPKPEQVELRVRFMNLMTNPEASSNVREILKRL